VAYCESGAYAANLEKATSRGPSAPTPAGDTGPAPERFATPGVTTIDDLARPPYGVEARRQIKTLVYLADGKPVLALLRGDDQLNEAKLGGALGTGQFRPATAEEVVAALGAHPGSLGAVGVASLPVYADETLRGAAGMVTGANADGYHLRHVSVARDLKVGHWADLRTVRAGETCVATGRPLRIRRAIEVGHVFKLGTKYSEALGAKFHDADGQPRPAVMGCYGIGVTRTMQAVVEQHNDANGICWPVSVAPCAVEVLCVNVQDRPSEEVAARLYRELLDAGVEALYDDRDERPGVKFKDADLLGLPFRVSVGERSLKRGVVEIKVRATGQVVEAAPAEAGARVREMIAAALRELDHGA